MKIIPHYFDATTMLKFLRFFNVCLAFSQDYILDNFSRFNSTENKNILKLLIIYLPINYFYSFLFYTDMISIVLIMYYFSLNICKNEEYKKTNKPFYFLIGKIFLLNYII